MGMRTFNSDEGMYHFDTRWMSFPSENAFDIKSAIMSDSSYTFHSHDITDHCSTWDSFIMDETALLGLGPQADTRSQQQALEYFERLKTSDDGWKLCASALTSGTYQSNDHVKFFCFQVLEHFLKTRYSNSGPQENQAIKSFLMHWLQLQTCGGNQEKSFIKNKAVQIFSLAFVCDYPGRWPLFFDDMLQSLSFGTAAVDIYLRLLVSIDSEVVDREIVHTPQETERNTMIKDTLRQQYVPQLVDSWYQIITTYQSSDSQLTCQCLEVIGAYVSWIDINLIANERFVTVLLKFMSEPLLRESTCDCIHEIISKGMDPLTKTKLIESFITVLKSAGVLDVTEDEEGDFLAKLAKLVNGIGLQLIGAWQKTAKAKDPETCTLVSEALESKVGLMFKFLSHEDDDVSGSVTQFAHDYITHLKVNPMNEAQKQNVKDLLYVVMKKMKFDDCYNFESEGEEEAMFQEYRKELKIIFNNIGALDADLILSTTFTAVSQILSQWQGMEYQDVEMAITMMYMLAEALPNTHGQMFSGDVNKLTHLQEMMRLLVSSNVNQYSHPAVALQFFETVVRYDKFFNAEPQYIPDVLMAFLDERGLRNGSSHVRSRSSYLFSRFVKTVNKNHLHQYLEEILSRVHELLVIHTPNNGIKHYLSGDDQQFLYETAGIIIIQSQFPPEKKQELMRQLLAPIVTKFDELLKTMISETDENNQLAYAQSISQALGFASRTSKGFSNVLTMKQSGCMEVYTDSLKVFLHALDVPINRSIIHQGVRQFLHRMVVCLEAEVLPFIPIAMENLLKNADARELHDFIPLINQVVMKFKKNIVPFLQTVFMPIVSTIFRVLSAPLDDRDQVAATENRMLQRSYFTFIAALVNNNVTEVLSQQESQNLHQVLLTVIQGAVELPDPPSQKICFVILKRLADCWGGKSGFNGFDDFMYKNIVPACFHAPMKSTFDMSDAQTVLVLNEAAGCLKVVADRKGDEFLNYMQNEYLPTLNLAPQISLEFCQALKSDQKSFRNYFKAFFVKAKS